MQQRVRVFVFGLVIGLAFLGHHAQSQQSDKSSSLVQDGASVRALTKECSFTEGPAVDAEGVVYFTDQPNNRIMKVDFDEKVSVFMENAGRSNGMYFDSEGQLITCADENNEMWEINADGTHKVLFAGFESKKLNGPNDLWIHPDGWIYFTDPYYQRPWWKHKAMPQDGQFIYRVKPDGSGIQRIESLFKQPNGIVGDADKGLLYVADIGDKKTYRFKIDAEGMPVERMLFCEFGSDGMTLDDLGNLYLTGNEGVMIFNSDGDHLETISVPESWTANVCFGGKDRSKLFITASKGLYVVDMKVHGI